MLLAEDAGDAVLYTLCPAIPHVFDLMMSQLTN